MFRIFMSVVTGKGRGGAAKPEAATVLTDNRSALS
jgi:hypothetical protein